MKVSGIIKNLVAGSNPLPLYAAAFFMACGGGIWFVAMPFIIKRLNGTDAQLGLCIGLGFASYLIGCLGIIRILNRLNPKISVQIGAAANALLTAAIMITVIIARNNPRPLFLWTVICAATLSGLLTALFWPPLMGWLSTGYEGSQLNRRLGIFNIAWSFGGIITPYIGGLLVENSSVWPFAGMIAFALIALAAISTAKSPAQNSSPGDNTESAEIPSDTISDLLPPFRRMARIALLTSFVCIGLARTQLAVLFKYRLNFSESSYGTAMMIMGIAGFIIFVAAGKTHSWHYKFSIFLTAQFALLLSMFLILMGSSLNILFIASALIGIGEAFMYISHLYYGVSGGINRSGRMALHEFLLSTGFVIGSFGGGWLSDHFNHYIPYWFGFIAVTLGLALQFPIYLIAIRQKNPI